MQYAVIETGGKQYKVNKGLVLEIEKLEVKPGEEQKFDKVLLYVSDGQVSVGKPYLEDVVVSAKILEETKGKKIRVVKFRAKSKYRRKTGYRHMFSKVVIDSIEKKEEKKKSAPVNLDSKDTKKTTVKK
ncbi:50S ribosomal protein L21 [Candidatus Parcubacteria bacterium]|nr:MAG: 50S ribosomal protein L21 [Candidatus Parcubacteria bacterium]